MQFGIVGHHLYLLHIYIHNIITITKIKNDCHFEFLYGKLK